MIDVPVRVKEALRDGGYRKNYRIDVLKGSNKWEHYGDIVKGNGSTASTGKLILRDNGKYTLNCPKQPANAHLERDNVTCGWLERKQIVTASKNDVISVFFEFREYGSDADFTEDYDITSIEVLHLNESIETDFTITNDNLVDGTVKLDERMNSGNDFKFGLCEGSSIEFEYFDFGSIKDRNIKITLDVQYKDENGQLQWYSIPMGFYTIDTCQRQASTGIYKVTGYNNLKSKYLDAKANSSLKEIAGSHEWQTISPRTLDALIFQALDGYETKAETKLANVYNYNLDYDYYAPRWTLYDDNGNPTGEVIDFIPVDWAIGVGTMYNNNYYRIEFDLDKLYNNLLNNCPYLDCKISSDGLTVREQLEQSTKIYYNFGNSPLNYDVRYFYGNIRENDQRYMKGFYDGGFSTMYNSSYVNGIRGIVHNYTSGNTKFPVWFYKHQSGSSYRPTYTENDEAINNCLNIISNMDCAIYKADTTRIGSMEISEGQIEGWADVTLRQLKGALLETEGLIGNVNRTDGLFNGVAVNRGHLLPSDALFPDNNLLPTNDAEHPQPSSYRTLWLEDGNVQTIKYLIITYKGLDGNGNEKDYKLQRTVNTNGTANYNMSDNWLFRNLIWTAEQVAVYADLLVEKLRQIKWTPFELWGAGLPYLEVGDEIEVATKEHSYTSYIFQRQLKGIQNLEDNYVNGQLDIY